MQSDIALVVEAVDARSRDFDTLVKKNSKIDRDVLERMFVKAINGMTTCGSCIAAGRDFGPYGFAYIYRMKTETAISDLQDYIDKYWK